MTASPATSTPSVVATASGAITSRYWVNYSQTPTTATTTTNALPTAASTSSTSEATPSTSKAVSFAAPKSSTNPAVIGAGIGAGFGGVVIVFGVTVCCRAHRRHKKHRSLTKRGHKPQSSISLGKEAISNPLLQSPAHHSWLTMSPSTLVELASPIESSRTALKNIPSSPAGGPFELAASPVANRAELPGDLPSELPGQVSSHGKDIARSPSTSSRKLKTINLPKFRSPSFSPWRPPAELASTPASAKSLQTPTRAKSESRNHVAKSGAQRDHTPATEEPSPTPGRAKSASRSSSTAKNCLPALSPQTPTTEPPNNESGDSAAKTGGVRHLGEKAFSHESGSSPSSSAPRPTSESSDSVAKECCTEGLKEERPAL